MKYSRGGWQIGRRLGGWMESSWNIWGGPDMSRLGL